DVDDDVDIESRGKCTSAECIFQASPARRKTPGRTLTRVERSRAAGTEFEKGRSRPGATPFSVAMDVTMARPQHNRDTEQDRSDHERLRSIIDRLPDGIVIINGDGIIRW